jgi:DNA-damage-inducible protein D
MIKDSVQVGPHKDFESNKHIDENGVEFWYARELMSLLGYKTWRRFEEVIERAKSACLSSSQKISDHFADVGKSVASGTNNKSIREVKDYKLDRYACYLIAQNGDSRKRTIALAQTYFAIQTRKQEISQSLPEIEKRVFIRGKVIEENKKLFKTAKTAGVSNFGSFNDAGYRGLYNAPLSEIEKRKSLKKGSLLDHAGTTELAANLFRITQTEDKIRKENIRGQDSASQTHFSVGAKVRKTIKDIGGTLPENLKPEKHIKEAKNDIKGASGKNKKLLN